MRPCDDKSDFIEYTHFEQRVWWITGVDSEFSRQLALAVVRHGDHVVWSAPEEGALEKFSSCFPERVILDPLEASAQLEDVHAVLERATERFGRVDVLVHVDGLARMSAVEDLDLAMLDEGLGQRLRHAVHLVRPRASAYVLEPPGASSARFGPSATSAHVTRTPVCSVSAPSDSSSPSMAARRALWSPSPASSSAVALGEA